MVRKELMRSVNIAQNAELLYEVIRLISTGAVDS
jgi:hypothetical protein